MGCFVCVLYLYPRPPPFAIAVGPDLRGVFAKRSCLAPA
jgi:hypothetical protein